MMFLHGINDHIPISYLYYSGVYQDGAKDENSTQFLVSEFLTVILLLYFLSQKKIWTTVAFMIIK